MKIGLVCPYNMLRGGGVQECVLAMQSELERRGHSVSILTPQPRVNNKTTPENIVWLGRGTDVKSFHTTAQVSVSANSEVIERVLADNSFDILHFHEPWVPVLSRQILSRSKSINVATFHAKLPDTFMSRTIERVITPYTKSILKYLNGYTAVSTAAADYISTLTSETINIIPNGIDLSKYTALPRDAKPKKQTILYIGRIEKRKGVKYLLKAYKELTASMPDVELLIAGDGPEKQKLEDLANTWKLANVQFLGFIDEKTKLKLLREATVFCSPARYGESFGIVLLEAMASGTAIVAGDNPGYVSVLQDTGASSLVNPKSTSAFSKKLLTFLQDETMRNEWVAWGLAYVKQFDYVHVIDKYEDLYKSLSK